MAINWVSITITASIGLAGGLLSGLLSSLAGRLSINRTYQKQQDELDKKIEERCLEQFDNLKDTLFADRRKCFDCEKIIPEEATFCTYCGVPVRGTKMCSECKVPLPENAYMCYLCGKEAIDIESTGESTAVI